MINVIQNDLDNCEDGSIIKHQNNEKNHDKPNSRGAEGKRDERKKIE